MADVLLNVGCGDQPMAGFVNLDLGRDADLKLDVRHGLPCADNTVDNPAIDLPISSSAPARPTVTTSQAAESNSGRHMDGLTASTMISPGARVVSPRSPQDQARPQDVSG